MSTEIAELLATVSADTSGFEKKMGGVKSLLGDMGGLIGGLSFAGLFGDAIKEAAGFEKQAHQLNNVLASTGGVAGVTADAAINLAQSFAEATTYSDDAILGAENLMLTFTNVGSDIFPTATAAVLDMSEALGQDLKSSTIQLGKALNDPIKGITALSRVGVNFNDEQKRLINTFMQTNRVADAQGVILAELQKEFGDSAFTAGDTFDGALKQLKNSFGEIMQSIGTGFLPMLTGLVKTLKDLAMSIANADPGFLQFVVILGLAAAAIGPLGALLGALLGPLGLLVGAVALINVAWQNDFAGIKTTVTGVIAEIKPALDQLGADLGNVWGALSKGPRAATSKLDVARFGKTEGMSKDEMAQIPVGQASADQNNAEWVKNLKIQIFTALADLGKLGGEIRTALAPVGQAIMEALKTAVDNIWPPMRDALIGQIQTALSNAAVGAQNLVAGAGALGGAIVQKILEGLKSLALDVGTGILKHLGDALQAAGMAAQAAIQGGPALGAAIIQKIVDSLGGLALSLTSTILLGIGGAFTQASIGALGLVQGAGALGTAIINAILGGLGNVKDQLANFIAGGVNNALVGIAGQMQGAIQGVVDWLGKDGYALVMGVFQSISDGIGSILSGAAKPLVSAVVAALKAVAAIFKGLPGGAGMIGIALEGSLAAAGYAQGGSVAGGVPIVVGEKGPELFVPQGGGTIVPNFALGGAGGGGNVYGGIQLYAYGVSDPVALVNMVDRELDRRNMPKVGRRS